MSFCEQDSNQQSQVITPRYDYRIFFSAVCSWLSTNGMFVVVYVCVVVDFLHSCNWFEPNHAIDNCNTWCKQISRVECVRGSSCFVVSDAWRRWRGVLWSSAELATRRASATWTARRSRREVRADTRAVSQDSIDLFWNWQLFLGTFGV